MYKEQGQLFSARNEYIREREREPQTCDAGLLSVSSIDGNAPFRFGIEHHTLDFLLDVVDLVFGFLQVYSLDRHNLFGTVVDSAHACGMRTPSYNANFESKKKRRIT